MQFKQKKEQRHSNKSSVPFFWMIKTDSRQLLFNNRSFFGELFQQLLNRGFQLSVFPGQIVFRSVLNSDVRLYTVIFQVGSLCVREEYARTRCTHSRTINQ